MVDLSSIIWLHYGVDRRLLDRIAYLESAIVLLRSDWVSLLWLRSVAFGSIATEKEIQMLSFIFRFLW